MSKNIGDIIDTWVEFDIKSIQHELDDKVIEIAQQLEEGDLSRKRLIEQTKEFRKGLNEEQRKLIAPILKSFQIEVDTSSKRSKLMEQVLLKLYKQLIDLPDPKPALENAQQIKKKSERVQDLEIENKQLRETLDDYNVEFAQVKNQEVTIKVLKDKIKEMEEKSEQMVQQRIKEKEKELQRFFSEKEDQLQNNQLDLVKKLGDTEAKYLSLQSQFQKSQSELYEIKQRQDELLNAKTCEIDILMQDLDKMSERAVNAERLAEQYIEKSNKQQKYDENEQIAENNKLFSNLQTNSYEIELAAKEKEISQLVEDIQKLQMKSVKSKDYYENQRAQLEERLNQREKVLEKLENELKEKLDYEEIKRELNILKSIEFNLPIESLNENPVVTVSNENTGMVTNLVGAPSGGSNEQPIQKPLEILLLEKNRFLQSENTQIKNKLIDLQMRFDTINKEYSTISKTNLEQKSLIVELEKDLLRLVRTQQITSPIPISPSVQSQDPLSPEPETLDTVPTNNSVFDLNIESQTNSDVSLLNIVSNQRERFRVRVNELESENIAVKQQSLFLTNEIDRLRSDNVKLYEKIKFLQSVTTSKSSNKPPNDFDYEEGNFLNKYNNEYEKRLDPFSSFNLKEKQKRYTNLKLHDKFTLNFSRFILSNKTSRLVFCAYFLIVHLLIFINLYNVAHNDASRRDLSAECASSYRDHMHKVHGMDAFKVPH